MHYVFIYFHLFTQHLHLHLFGIVVCKICFSFLASFYTESQQKGALHEWCKWNGPAHHSTSIKQHDVHNDHGPFVESQCVIIPRTYLKKKRKINFHHISAALFVLLVLIHCTGIHQKLVAGTSIKQRRKKNSVHFMVKCIVDILFINLY